MNEAFSACGRMIHLKVHRDAETLAAAVAELLRKAMLPPEAPAGPRALMLAGGSTPMAAYRLLVARTPVVDSALRVFFSDDRQVPPNSPRSNYGTFRPLLEAMGIGADRTLRVHGEQPLAEAVRRLEDDLQALLAAGTKIPLGLLGLGADGHTASLFTRGHLEASAGHLAIGVDRPDGLCGVSVTPGFLSHVERIVFVVAGADKRPMTTRLLLEPLTLTAGLAVRGHGKVELWVDPAAAPA